MSDNAHADERDSAEERRSKPGLPAAVETTETYETDEGTVFYDAENPLAWLQTDSAVTLTERV
ncbi:MULTISPECIES: DUF7331 family protein [Halomicrobium]|uniref:Uncharacterized protein n=2 Tax=Halomicrobium mukohataei TaxID=57705 RepID=C7P0Y5_HALMD|nr:MULTISPECIES: hypothetical protein [Halomicrobium]ACV49000.1 hypothetical protein Hmuk_2895 [Halomicrobium mukohataei DSM 12286]QCD64423.1 hypothetical protein E5139_01755 [Halomicrobium mukohataei]QFR19229.1 hypothetical protein GBQ70_01755 [Halomicrobium sp. ZPS1]